jgi:WD40 repeat protein
MNRSCLALLPYLAVVTHCAPLPAAAPPAGPSAAEVERLIGELGDDDFDLREAATGRLKLAGEPALDALYAAKAGRDLEVRRRAGRVITAVEGRLYPELRLTGHTDKVWCVCVSADGKRVLSGSADRTLRLWDAHTGKCLRVFAGHAGLVRGAALSPDGKRALSGSSDKTVRLWDTTTGKERRQMTGHADEVQCVAFGPEGEALSGSSDLTMRLWDVNTGKEAGVFAGHTHPAREVAYSGKANLAVTCSLYGPIHLWDLETGKEARRIARHGRTSSVCFSPDGKRLVSAGGDRALHVWDAETGKELTRIDVAACCTTFSPDGKRVVSGGYPDGVVRVWDVRSGKELLECKGHTGAVVSVAYFPDGRRVASASHDGTVRVWRVPR